jgi:hypothetical protein
MSSLFKKYCYKTKVITCCALLFITCLSSITATAQKQDFFAPTPAYNSDRVVGVVIGETVLTAVVGVGLNYLWYKKFPHSRFHFMNDNNEWQQMDKFGHATTGYNLAAAQSGLMRWGGVKPGTAAAIGTLTSLGLMTLIEVMDGHSTEWGFSKGDLLADIAGCVLFEGQQLMWGEQRMGLRYSYHRTIFPNYHPEELGANGPQRMLKDYNGQTYWLSVNISSFLPGNSGFPRWINAAAGYGAEGMISAVTNPKELHGKAIPDFDRYRQFYFSIDTDLGRINGLTPFEKTLSYPNTIFKMPAPTIEWNKKDKFVFHAFYH